MDGLLRKADMSEEKYIEFTGKDNRKWDEIRKEYIEKVCEVFKIEEFCAANHPQYDETGQLTGEIWIDYIWMAEIHGEAYGSFVLAVAQMHPFQKFQENVIKAMLIIPTNKSIDPNRYFELVTLETDHSIKAMQAMPLMHVSPLVHGVKHFNLYGYTTHNKVRFSCHSQGKKSALYPIWQAIRSTVDDIRKVYNNPEIEAYFNSGKGDPYHDEWF
jgi:hypothetical protein